MVDYVSVIFGASIAKLTYGIAQAIWALNGFTAPISALTSRAAEVGEAVVTAAARALTKMDIHAVAALVEDPTSAPAHHQELLKQQLEHPHQTPRLVVEGGLVREFNDELDSRELIIMGDDSAGPSPQNNLPMRREASGRDNRGNARRGSGVSDESFGQSTLTREAH